MSFKISLIHGQPVWDSLPVAKIVNYPLEPRDYKPFAQARLCVSDESIWVRLWAFEATPSPTSTVMAKLNFYPELTNTFLSLAASNAGVSLCEVCEGGKSTPVQQHGITPAVKAFASEDLQGIYWGVVFEVPRALLTKVYGTDMLMANKQVKGNLYKTDTDKCSEHYGCFYQVDFLDEAAYGAEYLGNFELVEY